MFFTVSSGVTPPNFSFRAGDFRSGSTQPASRMLDIGVPRDGLPDTLDLAVGQGTQGKDRVAAVSSLRRLTL